MTSIESTTINTCHLDPTQIIIPTFSLTNSIYSMTVEMNFHRLDRRAAGDDGSSNHSNSTQSSKSQTQGANTSSSQNSTTTSHSESTSQSQSTSKQPSQSYTQAPSPSTTNATSPSNNNGQNQNNQTQAQSQGQGQEQGQSTPNASSPTPTNSTSPQPSVNNAAPSNTSTPNASKSAPTSNSSVTAIQSKSSNSSRTAAPVSALNSSVPFSTTTASDGFGITGSSSQGDHQLSSNISPATIAGIAIGGVAGLILIILLALFCYRKRKSQKAKLEFQDSEKQKSLKRFSKESHVFNRLAGNTSSPFDTPSRRNSAPRLDIRVHQHHVSMESEEDRAASAGLSGLERRSSSLIDFFDQIHIHREPITTNEQKSSESEHMEFFFINEGAPELSNLVRKGSSSSSFAHSLTTSNSIREMIQKKPIMEMHHLNNNQSQYNMKNHLMQQRIVIALFI